ncbi:MAG: glutathione S-transferase [Paracoccaceae bacterium]|jgi:glutathione S-transferase
MQLYFTPGTISVAVAITLHEADIAFEPILVDFSQAEQLGTAYQQINPKGRVPALATPNGLLTETGAILDYIAAIAPQANLIPSSPYKAGKMREMMYYLASTAHINHAHKIRGQRWADNQSSWDDMAAKMTANMIENTNHIETQCLTGPYVLGDQFSLADPYLYVLSTWLANDGVDTTQFPKLTAFIKRMATRPSVQTVTTQGML